MHEATKDDDDQPIQWLDEDVVATEANWLVLIVDDEPEVHEVTKLVLSGLRFKDRGLDFVHAYDGEDARQKLLQNPQIAVILLDVVMETDDAGLRLVRHIRSELGNELVRIILRTGQAGLAPERQVIDEYDINDYKEKTDLTAQKLSTAIVAALRGYQALEDLAALNRELENKVAERTEALQRSNTQLQESLSALEQGERAGRRVQFKLLPKPHWRFGGIDFAHRLLPSEFMSGDFIDYFAIDEHRAAFYIADVSGHGVASAFITVYLKRFIAASLEAHRLGLPSAIGHPANLLTQLNQELLRERVGKHIAIYYGVIDCRTSVMCAANAGAHPYPWFATLPGCRLLEARSTPAGLLPDSQYENHELTLPQQFRLLMCSDGVLEIPPAVPADVRCDQIRLALRADTAGIEAIEKVLDLQPDQPRPDDLAILLIGRDLGQ